jgi:ABC-2 type transport system permease protein
MSQAVRSRSGTGDGDDPERRLGPLRPPGDTTGLFGVFQRRYLLGQLVHKELRVRYQGTAVGIAWSYIKPLVRFATYWIVVGYVIGLKDTPMYPYHVFSAMIVVSVFTETLGAGTKSVVKNKSLVRKMNVPREMFPVASLLVTVYHSGPQYLVMAVACAITGWAFSFTAVAAILLSFVIIVTFSLAVGLAFSALNVWYRDVQNFVDTISHVVRWTVPMIFPFVLVRALTGGGWVEELYLLNPVAIAVLLSEQGFWVPVLDDSDVYVMPDHLFERGLAMLAVSLLLVWGAQKVFTHYEANFAERL